MATPTLSSKDLSILMTDSTDTDAIVMWEDAEKALAALSVDLTFTIDHDILMEILEHLDLHLDPTPSIQKCVQVLGDLCRGTIKHDINNLRAMSAWVMRPIVSVILDSFATVLSYGGYFAVIDTPTTYAASEGWLGEVLLRSMYHMGCRNAASGSLLREVVRAPDAAPTQIDKKELGHPRGWYMPFADAKKTNCAPLVRPNTLAFHDDDADEDTYTNEPVFRARILRRVETMLRIYSGALVVAGGSALSMLRPGTTFSDVDVFLIGSKTHTPEQYSDIIHSAVALLTADLNNSNDDEWLEVTMLTTDNTVTINIGYHSKIQFVLSPYTDIEQLLAGFDLSSCKVAWDGYTFYAMPSADFSVEYGVNILDPLKVSIIKRAYKYNQRGFRFVVPIWGAHYESIVDMQITLTSIGDDDRKKTIANGGVKGLVAMAMLSEKNARAVFDVHEKSEAKAMYELRTGSWFGIDTYLEKHATFYAIRVRSTQGKSKDTIKCDGRLRHFDVKNITDLTRYLIPHDIKSLIVGLIKKENCGTASRYDEGKAPSFYEI
jgi:hypothetical protein